MVALLLERGANVNATDISGTTPFYYATQRSRPTGGDFDYPRVEALLAEKGGVSKTDAYSLPTTDNACAVQ